MEFTSQETKLIERLRKQNRQWVWIRWLVLAIGILSTVLCGGFGYFLYLLIKSEPGPDNLDSGVVFFIVLFWTKCCMYFILGVWSFTTVCSKWHGDVNRMLLLKLLDAQQKEKTKDDHAT
jgi:hypothetical protein